MYICIHTYIYTFQCSARLFLWNIIVFLFHKGHLLIVNFWYSCHRYYFSHFCLCLINMFIVVLTYIYVCVCMYIYICIKVLNFNTAECVDVLNNFTIFLGNTGVWTQGFSLANQELYCLNDTSSLLLWWFWR
jgi:hypothetical protein